MNKNRIAVLGGDLRQFTAALYLHSAGYEVTLWGLDKYSCKAKSGTIVSCASLEDSLSDAAFIILPLPASLDDKSLNAPLASNGETVALNDILSNIDNDVVVFGGKLPADFCRRATGSGIKVIDYFKSENFQIKNAYITAEAAISIAMNSLDKTVFGSRIAITGFGRISKHLTALLLKNGANVTIAARNPIDLYWAESMGCGTVNIMQEGENKANVKSLLDGFDIIYNTVPEWIFDREFLCKVSPDTFIIDLASAPGGVDICAAKELRKNVLWATSLPGKYAPKSAGELVGKCVLEYISDRRF